MNSVAARPATFFELTPANLERMPAMTDDSSAGFVRDAAAQFGDRFGSLTFTGENVRRRLSPATLSRLERTMRFGDPLDRAIAD